MVSFFTFSVNQNSQKRARDIDGWDSFDYRNGSCFLVDDPCGWFGHPLHAGVD
jgi:hypothetical protein